VKPERELGERDLNRALLERQLLLRRRRLSLPAALERMGGLQAQYAPSMYIGLWSRTQGLERVRVTRALQRRTVVQGTLLRATIHLVSAPDFWLFTDAVREARRDSWLKGRARLGLRRKDVEEAAKLLRRRLSEGPADRKELISMIGGDPVLFNGATLWLELVRVPPSGTWERRRADLYALAERWVERTRSEQPVRHLVRRYLAAFGPAPAADVADWAGLPASEVSDVLDDPELRRFVDERGGVLVDLPRAPLPGAGTKAPPRFLPTWDATLLVHARRTGILPERFRPLVFTAKTPQSVSTFLVDGAVAGTWREEKGKLRVEPFEPLPRAARRELDEEASRLARFVA
jgi:hypothetical protein